MPTHTQLRVAEIKKMLLESAVPVANGTGETLPVTLGITVILPPHLKPQIGHNIGLHAPIGMR